MGRMGRHRHDIDELARSLRPLSSNAPPQPLVSGRHSNETVSGEGEIGIAGPFQANALQLHQLGHLALPARPHAYIGHPLDTAAEQGAK